MIGKKILKKRSYLLKGLSNMPQAFHDSFLYAKKGACGGWRNRTGFNRMKPDLLHPDLTE
jgi:hypothetical protein